MAASLRMRRLRRAALVAAGAFAILAGTAGAAAAHATLVSTSPSQSTHYAAGSPPGIVTVTFDDGVTTTAKSIGVYDGSGRAVTVTPVHSANAKVVQAKLPKLADGGYAVVWHIISDDGHPETGAFTFSVGAAAAATADLRSLEAGRKAGSGIGFAFGVDRFLEFFGCLSLVGAVGFARWRWPQALARQAVRRMLLAVGGLAFVATLASIPLQAGYSSGGGTAALFDGSALRQVVDARFGTAALVRAGLVIVLCCYALVPFVKARRAARVAVEGPLALIGLGVGATFGYAGHGFTGRWPGLGLVLDVTHLTAAALWLGGLVLLATALRSRTDPPESAAALDRFSRLALPAIALVVLSGAVQGWRQIGTWSALWHTSYARLLVIKVLVVLAIVVIASAGRDSLRDRLRSSRPEPDLPAGPATDDELLWERELRAASGPERGQAVAVDMRPEAALDVLEVVGPSDGHLMREVRLGVWLEVGLAATVLAITSILVVSPPSREAEAAAKVPQAQTVHLETASKSIGYAVAVQPALVGQNTIVVNPRLLTGTGLLPTSLTGKVVAAGSATAVNLRFTALANGEWVAVAPFTAPGTWTVQLDGTSPAARDSASLRITIR